MKKEGEKSIISRIRKRTGRIVLFDQERITNAIFKAAQAVGGSDKELAKSLSDQVVQILEKRFGSDIIPTVEQIQDLVEKVLIENGHAKTAKAYILYREQRRKVREMTALLNSIEVIDNYVSQLDWRVKENSNMGYSLQGLNNHISTTIVSKYWLNKLYPEYIRDAHENARMHIHDLGTLGVYCIGWDLKDLLLTGFKGVPGKTESKPPKHFRTALGQMVNFFYTLQGECYSDDTEVLTDNGWKLFKDLDKKKDKIHTLNQKTKEIELQKPTNYFEFENKEMVHFHNNKIDLLVTPNHNMLVAKYMPDRGRKEYDLALRKADKYNPNTNLIPKGGEWKGKEEKIFTLPSITVKKYFNFIKTKREEKKPDIKIPMNDWLAFFGLWIAEGCCTKILKKPKWRGKYYEYYIRISQDNKENHKKIEAVLNKLPFNWSKKVVKKAEKNRTEFIIWNKQLYVYLSQFGKSRDKFVPKEIKALSKEQLSILFDCMMLGDGHISDNGNHEYYTNSKRLADDVQEIVLKLGLNANIREKHNKLGSWYVVAISRTNYYKINKHSIKKVDHNSKVYCVEVPNHTLYVRRNGKACWCGNSAGAVAFSNFDTLLAPFIHYDRLNRKGIKQAMQEFIFNMNVPTRVGFQCLSEDTEILTIEGWKKYDEIKEGMLIKTFNLKKGLIEDKKVKSVFKKKYQGIMYNLKNRIQDQLISPKHRIVKKEGVKYKLEPIEGILKLKSFVTPTIRNKELKISDKKIDTNIIKKVSYYGVIWCPNTENETVIARRNGKVFITGNTPFTNITIDLKVPDFMKDENVVVGGKLMAKRYKDFQEEMDWINDIFAEIMMAGDAKSRIFTFPIPTYSITKDFDWDNPAYDNLWKMTAKFGVPYFSNFIHSDMKPEDARSMCCRLRLSNRELRKRGGGLFGANPLTGSTGVVTINMAQLGYLSKNETEFFEKLEEIMKIAKDSLEIKRKVLEDFTEMGLYPYSKFYLRHIKEDYKQYWKNHFSTIGINGMNEALLNLINTNIGSKEGIKFTVKVLEFMRDKISKYQEETGNLYNLEATPAEGTSYRLAKIDKKLYPEIIVANEKAWKERKAAPFYTNCVSEDTECLTIDGWKRYNKIKNGDLILTLNTNTKRLEYQPVLYMNIQRVKKADMYNIKTKRQNQLVTPNHRILYDGNRKGKYQFATAENIPHRLIIPQAAIYQPKENIKVSDDFVRLMGWIVTEGHFEIDNAGIKITQAEWVNKKKFKEINDLLKRLKYDFKIFGDKRGRSIFRIPAKEGQKIKQFIKRKTIPHEFLNFLSQKQLNVLLDTLMKGDGSISKHSRYYSTGDRDLADKFQELCIKTGRRGVICDYKKKNGAYHIVPGGIHHTEITKHNVKKVKYTGIVWCPTVENGTWVARRSGKPFITGNSTQLPVDHTDDIFEALTLQEEIQTKYTGGVVLHGFLGEKVSSAETTKMLVKKIAENFKIPYYTLTPTFSVCPIHGYLPGEHEYCPKCDEEIGYKGGEQEEKWEQKPEPDVKSTAESLVT